MTNTLSSSLVQSYDRGIHTFRLRSYFGSFRAEIDICSVADIREKTLAILQKNPDFAKLSPSDKEDALEAFYGAHVQSLPLYPLYLGLLEDDSTEALSVLKALSGQQFRQIMDLDMWDHDNIVVRRATHWLQRYKAISSKELMKRFTSLDQEHQLCLFQHLFKGYPPEQVENLPQNKQNQLLSLPGAAYYYEVIHDDDKVIEAAMDLMTTMEEHNMELALSLLAHGSWLPQLENQHLAWQFSKARREELGFCSGDEIPSVFTAKEYASFIKQVQDLLAKQSQASSHSETHPPLLSSSAATIERLGKDKKVPFLFSLFHHLDAHNLWTPDLYNARVEDWIMCANHLASSMDIHPSHSQDRDFLFEHILAAHSLALDLLSNHDLPRASKLFHGLSSKSCLMYNHHMMAEKRQVVAKYLAQLGVVEENFVFFVSTHRYGLIQKDLDTKEPFFGLQFTELLKGFFNRFPLLLDHNSQDHGRQHIYHTPISSAAALKELSCQITTLLWITKLVHLAGSSKAPISQSASLDSLWLRSLASVLIGGRFLPRFFDKKNLELLASTPPLLKEERLKTFLKQMPSVASHKDLCSLLELSSHPTGGLSAAVVDQRTRAYVLQYFDSLKDIADLPLENHPLSDSPHPHHLTVR